MTNPIFDAGIFCIMLLIGSFCLVLYKKIGAILLLISILTFFISGLVVVTGNDVAFYKTTNPVNMTITEVNASKTTTITYHNITPSNETTYLIGNGKLGVTNNAITGSGELILGYSLLVFSLVLAVVFLDQTLKGNLIKGD